MSFRANNATSKLEFLRLPAPAHGSTWCDLSARRRSDRAAVAQVGQRPGRSFGAAVAP